MTELAHFDRDNRTQKDYVPALWYIILYLMENIWKKRMTFIIRIGFIFYVALWQLLMVVSSDAWEREVSDVKTLQRALNEAQAGDIIVLASQDWPNLALRITNGGEKSNPVIIRAAERGKVRLTGSSQLDIEANHVVIDGLTFTDGSPKNTVIDFHDNTINCRITNCAIIDYNAAPNTKRPSVWVSVKGKNHRIDHCAFTGRRDSTGLMRVAVEEEPGYHQIDHNYFGQFALVRKNGAETIRIIDTLHPPDSAYVRRASRTIVEYNLFEDCDGEGGEIISNKSSENIYRGNTFRRSMGALSLRNGRGCVIEGNFFLGEHKKGTMGVRVLGTDHRVINNYFKALVGKNYTGKRLAAVSVEAGYDANTRGQGYRPPVARLLLANNTIVGCNNSLVLGRGIHGATVGPTDCVIRDNTVVSSHGRLVTVMNKPERITWKENIMFGKLGVAVQPGITIADSLINFDRERLTIVGEDGRVYRPLILEDVGPFGTLGR